MEQFLFIPIIISILYFLVSRINLKIPKIKNLPLLICILLLALFLGMRSTRVGTDTFLYYEIYENYHFFGFDYALRQTKYLGWSIYVFILSSMKFTYHGYLIITSLFMMLLLYSTINFYFSKKEAWFPLILFVLLYSYCLMFNTFRFYFAICLILFSTTKLLQKKYFLFAFFVLLAASIHLTTIVSIVLLPLFLIACSKKSFSHLIPWLFVSLLFLFLCDWLFSIFIKFFPGYAGYFSSSSTYGETISTKNHGRQAILRIVELFIGIFFVGFCKSALQNTKGRFLIFLYFFSNLIGLVFYNSTLLSREVSIFLSFDFLTLAYFPKYLSTRKEKFSVVIVFLCLFYSLYYVMLFNNYGGIMPYSFY
jgi:hypothetical protein